MPVFSLGTPTNRGPVRTFCDPQVPADCRTRALMSLVVDIKRKSPPQKRDSLFCEFLFLKEPTSNNKRKKGRCCNDQFFAKTSVGRPISNMRGPPSMFLVGRSLAMSTEARRTHLPKENLRFDFWIPSFFSRGPKRLTVCFWVL